MKLFPYYTLDGLTQIGDVIIDPADIATIRCLSTRPNIAQVFMKKDIIPTLILDKASILDYLMPISYSPKLDRPFNTGLTGVESVSGSVTVSGLNLNFASSGTPAIYTRNLDAISLTAGKRHQIILTGISKTGNGDVKIKLGAHQVILSSAQIAAIIPDPIVVNLMLDSATDDLEISLINCTVASTFVTGRISINEVIQIPLQSFEIFNAIGVSQGTLYVGPNYGGGVYAPAIQAVRNKLGTSLSQVYFVDGGLQGVFIDSTVISDYLLTYTTID